MKTRSKDARRARRRALVRLSEAAAVPDGVAVHATVETRRRLRADVLDRLGRTGALDPAQCRAGETIRLALQALERGLMPRHDLGAPRVDGARIRDPLDRLSAEEVAAIGHYRAWAALPAIRRRVGAADVTVLALVVAVVVDNSAPRGLDADCGLRDGRTCELVGGALSLFARHRRAATAAGPAVENRA